MPPQQIFPEVKASDLYCSGFVRATSVSNDLKVVGRYNSDGSALAAAGDYIYVGRGSEEGVLPGAIYDVIRPTKKISSKGKDLGRHYLEAAQVRVVMVQPDFSLARVVYSCEAVEVGDIMIPFEPVNLPAIPRPRPFSAFMTTSGEMHGSVAVTKDALSNFGSVFRATRVMPGVHHGSLASLLQGIASEGMVVYVDLGLADGAKPGDIFIIYRDSYRDSEPQDHLYRVPGDAKKLREHRTAIGELVLVKVEDRASSGLVTYSTAAVSRGDSVERR